MTYRNPNTGRFEKQRRDHGDEFWSGFFVGMIVTALLASGLFTMGAVVAVSIK